MKHLVLLLVAVALLIGCGTTGTPDPCGEPIRVPAPYWDPPTNLPTLPPPPQLLMETFHCPPGATDKECADLALRAYVADYLRLLADDTECRFTFDGLVTLVESVTPVPPPPPGDAPPLDQPN
jgi:hypothetical protein